MRPTTSSRAWWVGLAVCLLILPAAVAARTTPPAAPSHAPTPGHLPMLPSDLLPRSPRTHGPLLGHRLAVNPYAFYTAEPAPMGITDFGLDHLGNGYRYTTNMFYGDLYLRNLSVYDASNSPATQLTVQLNIVLTFRQAGSDYAFWIQDVAFFDTSTNQATFLNNIWNFSSTNGSMDSNSVSGNGSVYGNQFYEDGATTTGNGAILTFPAHIELLAVAKTVAGLPVVLFEYRVGGAWETYDNVSFPFAPGATNVAYTVDGTQLTPFGLYYDAELILGGPGGGSQTAATSANLTTSLEFFNGHNFQSVQNAYDFGSDTAEGISGVHAARVAQGPDGQPAVELTGGSGTLGASFDRTWSSSVNLSMPVAVANVSIGGDRALAFLGGHANLTVAPGNLSFDLYNGTGRIASRSATISAGTYRAIAIALGAVRTVRFDETGLTGNRLWHASVGAATLGTRGTSLAFYFIDGNYTYEVPPLAGFIPNVTSGTLAVAGAPVEVNVTFVAVVYAVQVFESGLPSGTTWTLNVNGQNFSTSSASLAFLLPNGTFVYRIGHLPGWWAAAQSSGTWAVNGAAISKRLTFVPFTYQIVARALGLPINVLWGLRVGTNLTNGSVSTLMTRATNGTYPFQIVPSPGWQATPRNGTLNVAASDVELNVSFTPFTFLVTFEESGLPNGTVWGLVVDGVSVLGGTPSLTAQLPNGSFVLSPEAVPGYALGSPSNLSVRIAGAATSLRLTFAAVVVPDGELIGSVSPAGASLTVDGQGYRLSAGSFDLALTPGRHLLEVTLSGYRPYFDNVSIASGARTILHAIVLSPVPGPGGTGGKGGTGGGTSGGSSTGTLEIEAGLGGLAVAGLLGLALYLRRRSR